MVYRPTAQDSQDGLKGYTSSSKLLMAVGYLFLLTIVPNIFGWGLVLLCVSSSTVRHLLFEPWTQRDGTLLFSTCCWKIQSFLGSPIKLACSALSTVLEQAGGSVGLSSESSWTILLTMPVVYILTVLGWKVRDWLNIMLLRCELRVEIVFVIVAIALIVPRRFTREEEQEQEMEPAVK